MEANMSDKKKPFEEGPEVEDVDVPTGVDVPDVEENPDDWKKDTFDKASDREKE